MTETGLAQDEQWLLAKGLCVSVQEPGLQLPTWSLKNTQVLQ